MMLLSSKCQYGLRAALYLAIHKEDGLISIKEISSKLGISFHFLTKILQHLSSENLVESYKGPKGGVRLTVKGLNARLYDLVDIIDGLDTFQECVLGLPGCGSLQPCALHNEWVLKRDSVKEMLQSTTLERLANESGFELYRLTVED